MHAFPSRGIGSRLAALTEGTRCAGWITPRVYTRCVIIWQHTATIQSIDYVSPYSNHQQSLNRLTVLRLCKRSQGGYSQWVCNGCQSRGQGERWVCVACRSDYCQSCRARPPAPSAATPVGPAGEGSHAVAVSNAQYIYCVCMVILYI